MAFLLERNAKNVFSKPISFCPVKKKRVLHPKEKDVWGDSISPQTPYRRERTLTSFLFLWAFWNTRNFQSVLCGVCNLQWIHFAFCSDLYDPRLPNNKKHRAASLQMGIILHGVHDSNFSALATYDTTSSTRLLHTATFFHSHCCISPHLADLSVLRFATPISIANCTNNFCNHVAREKSVVKWKKNLYNKSAGNCYSVVPSPVQGHEELPFQYWPPRLFYACISGACTLLLQVLYRMFRQCARDFLENIVFFLQCAVCNSIETTCNLQLCKSSNVQYATV